MPTATIQIGNTDNKLTQQKWSQYVDVMNRNIAAVAEEIHFSGGSAFNAPWQNACWVVQVTNVKIDELKFEVECARKSYEQDSAAVTIGETILV